MAESNRKELDLVWGAGRIGEEINTSLKKAYHLLETGAIPARKVGKCWVAERGKLRRFFLGEELKAN